MDTRTEGVENKREVVLKDSVKIIAYERAL